MSNAFRSAFKRKEPDRPYLEAVRDISFRPIFIIGAHRSGTTLFYNLLAATRAFNFVRYYHITNYDEILANHYQGRTAVAKKQLANHMATIGLRDRIFDRVRVHPDLPEEYGFILKRRASILDLPLTHPRNRHRLVELCRKIQVEAGENRPILLKNPWDSANFLYLRRAFPTARFLFIHRHPLAGLNSRIKAMRGILKQRNDYTALLDPGYARLHDLPLLRRLADRFFSSPHGLDVRLITFLTKQSTRYYLRNLHKLPPESYTEITYEELCREPNETIETVLDFLQLDAWAAIDFASHIRPRPLNLLPSVANRKNFIQRQLHPYMTRISYTPF